MNNQNGLEWTEIQTGMFRPLIRFNQWTGTKNSSRNETESTNMILALNLLYIQLLKFYSEADVSSLKEFSKAPHLIVQESSII